jgi:hypothetical protein
VGQTRGQVLKSHFLSGSSNNYRDLVYLFKALKEYWMGLVVLPI